jgi:hypothetical protein
LEQRAAVLGLVVQHVHLMLGVQLHAGTPIVYAINQLLIWVPLLRPVCCICLLLLLG